MSASASRTLLLACAQPWPDSTHKARIQGLLREPIDWHDVLKGASWHGVTPLLAMNLREIAGVPDQTRTDLSRFERVNAFRSLHLAGQIRQTLVHLQRQGIEAIPWKGPALAFEAYGELTRRSSCDIDFLVKPGQLSTARDVLLNAGFTFEEKAQSLSPERRSRMEELSGEVRLMGPDRSFLLELHSQFLPLSLENPAILREMWDRSNVITGWDRQPMRSLALNDLLLTLCVHATKHGWDRLKWVADIAAVLTRNETNLDWTKLLASADLYKLRGMLLLGIGLAHRHLHAVVPSEVLGEINAHAELQNVIERQDRVYAEDKLPINQFAHSLRMRLLSEPLSTKVATVTKETLRVMRFDLASFAGSNWWLWTVPFYRPWQIFRKQIVGWCSRWTKLSSSDKQFIVRAAVVLLAVRIGLWLSTFRRVLALSENCSPPAIPLFPNNPPTPQQCAQLIPSAARLVPHASCLTQAIAGRWLLRSTGEECQLQVGVAKHAGKFSAHAVLIHKGATLLGARPQETYHRIFSS